MTWSIGKKIGVGFGLALTVIVLIGVVAYRSTNKYIETSSWVTHSHQVLERLDTLFSLMKDAQRGERGYIITGQDNFLEPYNTAINKIYETAKDIRKLTADNPNQQRRLDKLEPMIAGALAGLKDRIETRKTKGLDAAIEQVRNGPGERTINEVRSLLEEMQNEEEDLLKQRSKEAEDSARKTIDTIVIGTGLSFLLFFVGAFFIIRSITVPLRDGINVLAAASSEILAATTQVASSAQETATAVNETGTTVEEVKQTALVSSQKGKYVSESAQKVAQVSVTGRKSIEDSIEAMNRIKNQTESVADNIVKLSEQSQSISEIIAAVNDLAEQSNLLAVNAAIEAAKAGEQGKGFSVVAQEVKSLAEQSKHATNQVRTILSDIQKSIGSAVMSTEQASRAVETGVKQTTEAGESIRILSDTITESAQAATQIAVSSQQQLVGMDQVGLAMQNIKQATDQNVGSSKQVETTAQSLHHLGQKLRQLIEGKNGT